MKIVAFKDKQGRLFRRLIPDKAPDKDAEKGIEAGPPELDLDMPVSVAVRLHNELYHRGIFSYRDAKERRHDVVAALQAAYKVDAGIVVDQYLLKERERNAV